VKADCDDVSTVGTAAEFGLNVTLSAVLDAVGAVLAGVTYAVVVPSVTLDRNTDWSDAIVTGVLELIVACPSVPRRAEMFESVAAPAGSGNDAALTGTVWSAATATDTLDAAGLDPSGATTDTLDVPPSEPPPEQLVQVTGHAPNFPGAP
jgi:hypothetical protein